MEIRKNVSLKNYSTMRLGGEAKALVKIHTKQELVDAVAYAEDNQWPWLLLGGGSNVIFSAGFDGLVIVNAIPGIDLLNEDNESVTIRVGAGENWDKVVAYTVDSNLHGIESLSAIPGTAGATPVQNVGAYGAQISDTLVELEAYNTTTHEFVTLQKDDCGFAYRMSIFKSPTDRHYIITSITLRLLRTNPKPPFYDSLQRYLDEHQITEYTPKTIREAVREIRAIKLPDPSVIANTGSFFKNPIVHKSQADALLAEFPNAPHWPMPGDQVKFAAGWLIEQAGLKGYEAHGMATYEHHALVLVNKNAKSYDDLLAFQKEVTSRVHDKFGISLDQEPELL